MPTYDHECRDCGGFDAFRPIGDRNEPAPCPTCGAPAPRVFATAPRLALLSSETRSAMAVNERARHEPRQSGAYQRLAHPSGCGCCSTRPSATQRAANGNKAFPTKRPWMISH